MLSLLSWRSGLRGSLVCYHRHLFGSTLVCWIFGVLLCCWFYTLILTIMRFSRSAEFHSTLPSQAGLLLEGVKERRHLELGGRSLIP